MERAADGSETDTEVTAGTQAAAAATAGTEHDPATAGTEHDPATAGTEHDPAATSSTGHDPVATADTGAFSAATGGRDPVDHVRRYFDDLGEREWERLIATPRTRVSLEVHRRFLARFIQPGWRVLEVGAGPGRFTIEMGRLGARVVATDLSPVQLGLHARHVGATPFEALVEGRELVDVRDVSRYADGSFDAVVAFGDPLSYAFEWADEALDGLLRVVRPGGPVLASVISLLGWWRFFLADVVADAALVGEEAADRALHSGDLRALATDAHAHIAQQYRWRDVEALVRRCGGTILAASASNFASLGDAATVARLEADPGAWDRFLEHEVAACAEPGALDAGTHILFAATRVGSA